ncbi:MAG: indole-3-glycerol phosphate synthase TrpC [Actinomycetota bacterium]|nr:indole-3-glycerol phosphate synthase TrpC [Actinomycetota bacterium]
MGTYLDRIVEATLARIQEEKKQKSFNDLDREVPHAPEPRDFEGALLAEGMSLIAEIKKASPSAGPIQANADAEKIAEAYERGGARALSVLTEPQFFLGAIEDLHAAHAASDLPALRKDFIVDPYQVVQSRVEGADAILLIVAALPDRGLYAELAAAAREYDLPALIEVHDAFELELAFKVDASIVGINQRNLTTFEVDRGLAAQLRTFIPPEVAVVAESGIDSRAQVEELAEAGVDAILVGEALMRSEDPAAAVSELLGTSLD